MIKCQFNCTGGGLNLINSNFNITNILLSNISVDQLGGALKIQDPIKNNQIDNVTI